MRSVAGTNQQTPRTPDNAEGYGRQTFPYGSRQPFPGKRIQVSRECGRLAIPLRGISATPGR